MIIVCAWCERFLGLKEPVNGGHVSHGLCEACLERNHWSEPPVLVVGRAHAHLAPVFEKILRGTPEIRTLVDRRTEQRRREAEPAPEERRAARDRRGCTPAMLC